MIAVRSIDQHRPRIANWTIENRPEARHPSFCALALSLILERPVNLAIECQNDWRVLSITLPLRLLETIGRVNQLLSSPANFRNEKGELVSRPLSVG